MSGKPTIISTFSGCGGSSLGYQMAGFSELLAIDFDQNSVETFKLNFPEVPVWQRDITGVSIKEILDLTGLEVGQLDVLDGSPPCQGFSTAGKRQVNDPRNRLFEAYVELIKGLQPKVFVMENVPGMFKGKMRGMFLEIIRTLKKLNYEVKAKLMNAQYYQVPQSRERLIFIGVREDLGIEPSFPKPSNQIITVQEAIEDLEDFDDGVEPIKFSTSPRMTIVLENIQEGQSGSDIDEKAGYFNIVKLHRHKPSPTIPKSCWQTNGMLHYSKSRRITIAECKRLCSFPDDFQLIGSYTQRWARLGNAVMPLMMKAIALNILENILNV